MILVRPVNILSGEVVDAVPEFLGASKDYRLMLASGQHADLPFNWHTEVRTDGAIRVVWTTRLKSKERMFLSEAGFHVAEVPLSRAIVIDRCDTYGLEPKPITVQMFGSTAFMPKKERLSYRAGKLDVTPVNR